MMTLQDRLARFTRENPGHKISNNPDWDPPHLRHDTDEDPDNPIKANESLLQSIQEDLAEFGLELFDTQVEHDCITGSIKLLVQTAEERDARMAKLVDQLVEAKSLARRDQLFDQMLGVWWTTLAKPAPSIFTQQMAEYLVANCGVYFNEDLNGPDHYTCQSCGRGVETNAFGGKPEDVEHVPDCLFVAAQAMVAKLDKSQPSLLDEAKVSAAAFIAERDPPEGCHHGYGGCMCSCHRMPGVYHCVPCCYPGKNDILGSLPLPTTVETSAEPEDESRPLPDIQYVKFHYWVLSFGKPADAGSKSVYLGTQNKNITVADIVHARTISEIHSPTVCLVSASYLGHMTYKEFTGKPVPYGMRNVVHGFVHERM